MTEKRVTLAELLNSPERESRTNERIREEDQLVRRIIEKHGLLILSARTPLPNGGWDTTYGVQTEGDDPLRFSVAVRATLTGEALSEDIELQIESALKRRQDGCAPLSSPHGV